MASRNTATGSDDLPRCQSAVENRDCERYHDREWGLPTKDGRRLFEKLSLEGIHVTLGWPSLLRRRRVYRDAFDGFDIKKIARYGKRDVNRILRFAQIVQDRGKVEATINNAKRALEMIENEGSLGRFFWRFEPGTQKQFSAKRKFSKESERMSRELKKRGWKYVGPTVCYSFMQAVGIINDHPQGCFRWEEICERREWFSKPG